MKKFLTGILEKLFGTNAKKTDNKVSGETRENKEKKIYQEPIENTPFTLVGSPEGWFIAMGINRLSPLLKTKKEALENAKDATWNRVVQVIQVMIDANKHHDKLKQEMKELNDEQNKNDKTYIETFLKDN